MPERKTVWFRRATFWVPTWRTVLAVCLIFVLLGFVTVRQTHQFLSLNRPVPAEVLVVEGWLPDYGLEAAVREFERGGYRCIVAAGGPMPKGYLVSGYDTWSAIARDTLAKLGVPKDKLIEAPAPRTYRDRTYQSAIGVRRKLAELGVSAKGLNVVSEGPHARRTWLTYRKVFGPQTPMGVISLPPQDYDPARWWASSGGVKTTFAEALGWFYEWLFDAGREEPVEVPRSAP